MHRCPAAATTGPQDVALLGQELLDPTLRGVRRAALAGGVALLVIPAGSRPAIAGGLALGLVGGVVGALHPGNSSCSVRRRVLAGATRAGLGVCGLALVLHGARRLRSRA